MRGSPNMRHLEPMTRPKSLRDQRGFTLVELLVAITVASAVIAAIFSAYLGTVRSWEGTSSLANLQRDASFCIEIMTRNIRPGSQVEIGNGGDSLDVTVWTGSIDSLISTYYHDGNGNLIDINDIVLCTNVGDLNFSSDDDRVVNIDLLLEDDMGTQEISDDKSVFISSTVGCRN